jgi:uncharacterized membrane protein
VSGTRFTKRNQPSTTTTTTSITKFEASAFSGPLPHPDILARYNEVVPNGAERIFTMVERQSVHRESIEACVVQGNVNSQVRGSWFGFIVSMTAIVGGIYLIAIGKGALGLTSIISSLVALVAVFYYGKRHQKKELTEKSTALEKRRA